MSHSICHLGVPTPKNALVEERCRGEPSAAAPRHRRRSRGLRCHSGWLSVCVQEECQAAGQLPTPRCELRACEAPSIGAPAIAETMQTTPSKRESSSGRGCSGGLFQHSRKLVGSAANHVLIQFGWRRIPDTHLRDVLARPPPATGRFQSQSGPAYFGLGELTPARATWDAPHAAEATEPSFACARLDS